MMEKNVMMDMFVKELLGDGRKLTMLEIKAAAKQGLPKEEYDAKRIYNFVYNMTGRGELCKTSDGKYYMKDIVKDKSKIISDESKREVNIDGFDDFEIIDPSTVKSPKEVLSVMSSGTIAMNPVLLKHFEDFSAEIRLKKDCTEIIMLKYGKVLTNLGKQGRVKNYNLVERLKKANMRFPLYFVGEWDEEKELWHGKAMQYNPNKGKKEKQK